MCTCRLAVAPQSNWHSQEKSISSCLYPKSSSQLCSTSYSAGLRPKHGFPYPVRLKIEPFQKNISTGTYQATANGVDERGHRREALQIKELKDTCKTAKNKSKQDRLLAVMKLLVNIRETERNLSQLRCMVRRSLRTDSQTDRREKVNCYSSSIRNKSQSELQETFWVHFLETANFLAHSVEHFIAQ